MPLETKNQEKQAKATSTSDKTFEGLRGRLPGGAGAGGDNGCDPRPDAKARREHLFCMFDAVTYKYMYVDTCLR